MISVFASGNGWTVQSFAIKGLFLSSMNNFGSIFDKSLWSPRLGKMEQSMCFSCICLSVLHVLVFVLFLFLLVSGFAAVCNCGTPWTFLLTSLGMQLTPKEHFCCQQIQIHSVYSFTTLKNNLQTYLISKWNLFSINSLIGHDHLNIKSEMRSFKSNKNIHKKEGGSYYVVSANKASSVIL